MKHDKDLDEYLKDASSWEADRLHDALQQNRWLRWLAVSLLVIAGSLVWAIKGLTPLKTEKPYLVRVDSSTGIVDVVPAYDGQAPIEETVTRFLLTHYQTVRERYFFATAEADYETVGAFNNARLNEEWAAEWQEGNPNSPLVKYKDGTTVTVHIQGVTFLDLESGAKDTAQVRFTKEIRKGGQGAPQVTHWLSTIKYAYDTPSTDAKERALNPMGLRVISYRKEPEVIAEQRPAKDEGKP